MMDLHEMKSELSDLQIKLKEYENLITTTKSRIKTIKNSISMGYGNIIDMKIGDRLIINNNFINVVGGAIQSNISRSSDGSPIIELEVIEINLYYIKCRLIHGSLHRPNSPGVYSFSTKNIQFKIRSIDLYEELYNNSEWSDIIDREININQVIE